MADAVFHPLTRMAPMTVPVRNPQDALTEAQFRDNVKNGQVKGIRIDQQFDGCYHVLVQLKWKPADCPVVTTKKSIREWTSLDRLVRRIRSHYGIPPSINLFLNPTLASKNHGASS